MKTALLIIDMQKDYFEKTRLKRGQQKQVQKINQLISWSRKQNIPIVWIKQVFKKDLSDAPLFQRTNKISAVIEGTDGAQLVEGLKIEKNDKVIIKKRFSAFFETTLESFLKQNNIKELILAGINTMSCVRQTAIDAYSRDYFVILVKDAVNGHDYIQHKASLKYLSYAVAQIKKVREIIK